MINTEKNELNNEPTRAMSDVDVSIPDDLGTIKARKRRRDQRSVCETNKLLQEKILEAIARLPRNAVIPPPIFQPSSLCDEIIHQLLR